MKLFVVAFAIIAVAAAASVETPSNEYLPPVEVPQVIEVNAGEESAVLADDGYRYKVVRRNKYRHRRDVNELPSNEYLPPVESTPVVESQIVVEPQQNSAVLADDGYRYKVVRRNKYRHRRDVNELPSNEYLPPVESAPVVESQIVVEPQQNSAVLADDGYRYKVVRRNKYRHRRDVNELPSNEYLPPVESAPVVESQIVVEPQQNSAVLADDGYRYKVVRRNKYRHRRDVNELPSNEYLPPVESAPVVESQIVVEPQQNSAVLADDGYRYKVVRRNKYRHRRDVNELPSNEYLPPVESAPVVESQIVVEPQQNSAVLADDGYRYKVVRRNKYRHRRDVNELPSNEYLPPVESAPVVESQIVVEPQQNSAVLADDGYRYKVVRRNKYRHRRDVNELPSNEYLPPVESAPVVESQIVVEPQQNSAVLADDGYRYKVVRRNKYRHRRDVNELPSNEYLPPVESAPVVESQIVVEPQQNSAVLADDGYRYKVVRRNKYRHRRDVNELPSNEYLPPVESAPVVESQIVVEPQQNSAVLADDGYRYKVVRRLKYRNRRV